MTATGRVDFDRISEGGTLLEAAETGTLDCFADMPSASTRDLLLLADWGASYEFGYDDDEQRASMARAVGHVMREIAKRERAKRTKDLIALVAEREGLRKGDKRVVDAVRRYMAEHEPVR